MTTYVQILEGPNLQDAQVVTSIESEEAVQIVRDALAEWLARGRFVQRQVHPRRRRDWEGELGMTLQEWSKREGISYSALTSRMRRGHTFEEAAAKLKKAKR